MAMVSVKYQSSTHTQDLNKNTGWENPHLDLHAGTS